MHIITVIQLIVQIHVEIVVCYFEKEHTLYTFEKIACENVCTEKCKVRGQPRTLHNEERDLPIPRSVNTLKTRPLRQARMETDHRSANTFHIYDVLFYLCGGRDSSVGIATL